MQGDRRQLKHVEFTDGLPMDGSTPVVVKLVGFSRFALYSTCMHMQARAVGWPCGMTYSQCHENKSMQYGGIPLLCCLFLSCVHGDDDITQS